MQDEDGPFSPVLIGGKLNQFQTFLHHIKERCNSIEGSSYEKHLVFEMANSNPLCSLLQAHRVCPCSRCTPSKGTNGPESEDKRQSAYFEQHYTGLPTEEKQERPERSTAEGLTLAYPTLRAK